MIWALWTSTLENIPSQKLELTKFGHKKTQKIIYTLNLTLKVSYGVELTSSPGQEQSLILKQDGNELDWSKVISIQARTIPYSILGGSST